MQVNWVVLHVNTGASNHCLLPDSLQWVLIYQVHCKVCTLACKSLPYISLNAFHVLSYL